jgi:GNAT superfamily N-acetyltransferase
VTVTIERLGADEVTLHGDAIELVYRFAFAEDRATSARFRQRLDREAATFPGFQFHAAFDDGEVVGFIYGYRLQRSNWWPQMILPALTAAAQDHWLDDCFELVEFAVVPHHQGRGIGSRLYDALFAGVLEPRALLGTDPPPSTAHTFYSRRGWIPILTDWRRSPGDPDAHLVMGLDRTGHPHHAGHDEPR